MKTASVFPADAPLAAPPVVPEELQLYSPDEIEEYRHELWMTLGLAPEESEAQRTEPAAGRWSQAWSSVEHAVLRHLPFHRSEP